MQLKLKPGLRVRYADVLNPTAYWPLDDGAGTTARELGARRGDSSLIGMTPSTDWVVDQFGHCLQLGNAASTRIRLDHTLFVGLSSWTYAWWQKTEAADAGKTMAVWSGSDGSGNHNIGLVFWISGTELRFYTGPGQAPFSSFTPTALGDDLWHHYVIVKDNSGPTVYLYEDGVLVNSASYSSAGPYTLASTGWLIGQDQDSLDGGFSSTQDFEGFLMDLMFWDRPLTDGQARAVYAWGPRPFGQLFQAEQSVPHDIAALFIEAPRTVFFPGYDVVLQTKDRTPARPKASPFGGGKLAFFFDANSKYDLVTGRAPDMVGTTTSKSEGSIIGPGYDFASTRMEYGTGYPLLGPAGHKISINCWAKFHTLFGNDLIIANGRANGGYAQYNMRAESGRLAIYSQSGPWDIWRSTNVVLAAGKLHNIYFYKEAGEAVDWYLEIDGVPIPGSYYSGSNTSVPLNNGAEQIVVGNSDGSEPFDGDLYYLTVIENAPQLPQGFTYQPATRWDLLKHSNLLTPLIESFDTPTHAVIDGAVTITVASAAEMIEGRGIIGAVTVPVTISSAAEFTIVHLIDGALTVPVTINSPAEFRTVHLINGALNVPSTIAAGLIVGREVVGDLTVPLAIAAAFARDVHLSGDVTISIEPVATSLIEGRVLIGAVTLHATPASQALVHQWIKRPSVQTTWTKVTPVSTTWVRVKG